MEAHGGYSFCGLAALMLLGKGQLCNIDNLLKWTANRQMKVEGGFQVSDEYYICKEFSHNLNLHREELISWSMAVTLSGKAEYFLYYNNCLRMSKLLPKNPGCLIQEPCKNTF